MSLVPSRPPDFERQAETFGWNSAPVRRAIENFTGAKIHGDVTKAVADSTGGSAGPMIQQGAERVVYEAFIRRFPLYDAIAKEEANGLVHAYDTQTGYSRFSDDTPVTMTENASVVDDANTYSQATTNIAIFGTRRGASLKSVFAVRQGVGPLGDLSEREAEGGLVKIAHDVQAEMIRFQNTDAAGTVNTAQQGLYDANGFNGLRYTMLNIAPAGNTIGPIDLTAGGYNPKNQTLIAAVGQAADTIVEHGGNPDMIICAVKGKRALLNEQLSLRQNFASSTEIRPGVKLNTIESGVGELPIYDLPGTSVGLYTAGAVTNVQDIYVLDSSTLSLPWLGGPTPTVLDIPIGADGTLRKLKIPFLMVGFAMHVPGKMARVQVKVA